MSLIQPSQREATSPPRTLAILTVDTRRFSDLTDHERDNTASGFRDAMESAFARSDLSAVWDQRVFEQNTGDGLLTGFEDHHLRNIVDRIPMTLQAELRELHRRFKLRVRMRMGISVGPVNQTEDPRIDVAPSQPLIDACRLADSPPTRRLLEISDPGATYLAVAVSSSVMEFTLQSSPTWTQPSEYVRALIEIADKQYSVEAYLHVPTPSGELLRNGLVPPSSVSDSIETSEPAQQLEDQFFTSYKSEESNVSGSGVAAQGNRDVYQPQMKRASLSGNSAISGRDTIADHSRTDNRTDRSVARVGRDSIAAHDGDVSINNVEGGQYQSQGEMRIDQSRTGQPNPNDRPSEPR